MGTQFIEMSDGIRLACDEAGEGDPPMVLVHGWCCQRSYMRPQLEHFSRRYRTLAIDLRGHGESDVPEAGAYAIERHSDDIAELCQRLGVRRPVVVGHSMGGAIALALAARFPDVPSAIVMLDGAVLFPAHLAGALPAVIETWRGQDFRERLRPFVEGMFIASDDAALRRRIIEDMLAQPQHVVIAEIESLVAFDGETAAKACTTPSLYIGSAEPVADMGRLKELMPGCLRAQTAGAGHFHQLEVPEQVNIMIERFLAINGLSGGAR